MSSHVFLCPKQSDMRTNCKSRNQRTINCFCFIFLIVAVARIEGLEMVI